MADVNGTDHLVRHEKDNVGNGGYDNEGFHPCERKGEEEESSSDDDRLRVVVTENGHRTEGDTPLPNGHAREESISQSVNGTAVVVLGEEENDEDGSYKRFGIGECQSNMDSAQKPLDTRLHHYVAVDDVDRNILSNSDNTHVSIPEDAVISFSTGRVRVKNRNSSSPQAPRESIPLETIPTSYDVEDKTGIGLEKKAELEAELSNHKNGVWAETHIYSGAEGLYTSDKLNGTSKSSDEVSLPVNNHRKCLSREGSSSSSSEIKSTGEKLYFTEENRKLCPGWRRLILCGLILIIIAVAVCLGVLAATGILLAESDSKNIRHESSHQLPSMDSISHAGFPYRRPSSNVPQKFQPSVTTEVEFLPNTTSKTTNSVLDTVSPATPQVSSKVPVLNDATHSQTIVPNALVGEFTIIDENFTDDLNDNTSQGFLNLANNLELELRRIFRENKVNFEKLQILNFRPGSIKVKFVVIWIPNTKVISASKASEILAADLAKKNNSFFNLFHVDISTIHFIDVFDECRIQKGGCTFDCLWNYDTLVKTCTCPINTYLLSDGKSCGTEKEFSIATTETVNFSTTTPLPTEAIPSTSLPITTLMEKNQTISTQPTIESLLTTTEHPLLVEKTTITKLTTKSAPINEETTTENPQIEHTLLTTVFHQETTTENYETTSYTTITENKANEHITIKEDNITEYEHSTTTNSDVTSEKLILPTTTPEILQTLKEHFSDKGSTVEDKVRTIPLSETTLQPEGTEATMIYDTETTTPLIKNYTNNEENMLTTVHKLHSGTAQPTGSTPTNIYTTRPGVTEKPMESTTFNTLYKDTEEDKTTIKFHLIETPTELYTINTEFDYSTTLTESTTLSNNLHNELLTTTILPETNINSLKEIEAATQNNTATTFGYTDQPATTTVNTNVTAYPNTETEKSFTDLQFTTIKPETDYDTTKFTEEMTETEEKNPNFVTNFITTQSPTINPITNPITTLPQSSPQPPSNKTPGVRSFDNFTNEPTITTPSYTYAGTDLNETTNVPHDITSFSINQSSLSSQSSTKNETTQASTIPSINIYDLNQLTTAVVTENSTSYPDIDSTVVNVENRTGINNVTTKPYDMYDRNTTPYTEHNVFTETGVTEKFQNDYNETDTISLNKTENTVVPDISTTTSISYTTPSDFLNKQETTETIIPRTEVEDIFKEVTTTVFESETMIPSTTELKTTLKELIGDTTQYTTASNIDVTTLKPDISHLITPSSGTKLIEINETMSTTNISAPNTDNLKVFGENNNTETTTISYIGETITTTELPETVVNTEETVTPFQEITTPAFVKETTSDVADRTTINPLISEIGTETAKPIKSEAELTTVHHLEVTTQKNSYATNENFDTTLKYPPGIFLTTTVLPTTNILFNTEDENSQKVTVTKSQMSTTASADITGNNDHETEAITETAIPVTESYQNGKTNYTATTEKTTEILNNTNMYDMETTTRTILLETTTELTTPDKTAFVTRPTFENASTTEIHEETGNTEISDTTITTINAEAGTTMSLPFETETLLTFPDNKESFTTEPTNIKLSETTTSHTEVILPTTNTFDNETLMTENISNVTLSDYATTISILDENTNATEIPHDLVTLDTLNNNATTDIIGEITTELNKPEISTEENKFSLNFNASDETLLQEATSNATNSYDEIINETTTNASIGIECRDDQFICEPLNICLNNTFMCDGIPDCPDGTDEFDCQDSCHTNFMCINSSTCIMSEARCDGIWDCDNGTDEEFCTPTECAKHEVMCSDGSKCIKPVDICDWKYDCKDRSDEVGCVERTTCESNGKFFCNDGLCIPWSLKCDGEFDCKDKEDEGNCTCLNGEFQCNDGKCLKSSSRCDGHRDCHDGDDEMGCVNVDSQHMVMTFEPYSSTWALLCAEDFNLDDGHYLCQELGFGHALKVDKLPVSFNGTWMAMRRENLTDSSLWTERVSFIESCTSTLAAAVECQKFACGEYTGLLHRRKKRDILSSSSSSQWPFIGYTSTFRSNRGCLSEILTPIWLITSAECLLSISKEPFNGSDWYVRTNIGQNTETDLAQNHEVLRIISHPHSSKFRSLILRDYDVALVRLKHALVFVSDKIGAICPPEEQVPPGITCFSGVLGTEKPRAPPPSILSINSLALQIIDRKNCNTFDHYNDSVNQRMLCTQSSEGHTICDNDEGTPLMCLTGINKWFLAGMLTYQRYCEVYSKHPAVFSNLFAMRKFIDQVTGQKQYEIPYDSNVYVIIPPTTPSPTIPETTTAVYTTTEALSTTELTESTTLNYTTEYTTISEALNDTELTTIAPETTLNAENFTDNFTHTAIENIPTTTPATIVEEIRNDDNTTLEKVTHEIKHTTHSEDNYTTLMYPEHEFTYPASMENVTTIAPYMYEGREILTTTITDIGEMATLNDQFGLNDTNESETESTGLENTTSPYSVMHLDTMLTTTASKPEMITENIFNNKTETTILPKLTTENQSTTSQEPITSEFVTESIVSNFTESPLAKVIKLPPFNKTIITENITTILPILPKDHITTISNLGFTNKESTNVESTKNPYLVEEFSTTSMNSDVFPTESNETFIFEINGKPTEDLAFDVFTGKDGMRVESPGHLDNLERSSSFKESSSRSRNLNEPYNISDILYDLTTKSTTEVPFLTTTLNDTQKPITKAIPTETTKSFESQGTTLASTKIENVESLTERMEIATDRAPLIPGQTESKNMESFTTTTDLNKIKEAETIIPDIGTQPIMPRKLIEDFGETTLPSNFPTTPGKAEPVTTFTTNKQFHETQIIPDVGTQSIMPRKLNEDFSDTTLPSNFPITQGKTEPVTAFTTNNPFYEKQRTGKILEPVTEGITVSDFATTFNTETYPMIEDTTIIPEYVTKNEPKTTEIISHDTNTHIMYEETRNMNDYTTTQPTMKIPDINSNYSTSGKQAEETVTIALPITTTVKKDTGTHQETTNKATTIPNYTTINDEMKHYYEKQPIFAKHVDETTTGSIGPSEPFNFSKPLSATSPTVSDLKTFQETTLTNPDFVTTIHDIETGIKTANDQLNMSEQMTRTESTVTPEVFKKIEEITTIRTTNELKHNMQSLTTSAQPVAETTQADTQSPLYSDLQTTKVNLSSPYQTTPMYPFLNESFENQTSVTEFAVEIAPYLTTFPDIEYDRNIPIINDTSKLLHLSSEKVLVSEADNETDKCGEWNHFSNKTDFNTLKFYEEWPALGYLQMVSEPKMCAATIMSSHFVITSLSCLSYRDQQLNPDKWTYISGLNSSFVKGTQTHIVSEIIPHTDMGISLMFHKHNLALVRLKDAIEMTEFSKHVCLPNDTDLLQKCFATGWSKPTSGVDQEKMFYSVPVDILSQEECNSTANYNGLLLDTLICASYENKSSPTCKLDFGSPLFCLNENHWKLQGILDFSGPCDIAQPAVYNSISSVSNWILSFIQDDIL